MHFATEKEIMMNIVDERVLTFDTEGYIIKK